MAAPHAIALPRLRRRGVYAEGAGQPRRRRQLFGGWQAASEGQRVHRRPVQALVFDVDVRVFVQRDAACMVGLAWPRNTLGTVSGSGTGPPMAVASWRLLCHIRSSRADCGHRGMSPIGRARLVLCQAVKLCAPFAQSRCLGSGCVTSRSAWHCRGAWCAPVFALPSLVLRELSTKGWLPKHKTLGWHRCAAKNV